MDQIKVPKMPCPRKTRILCVDCQLSDLRNSEKRGCGKKVLWKVTIGTETIQPWCGMEYHWRCDECVENNRPSCAHIGEYETVGILQEEAPCHQEW